MQCEKIWKSSHQYIRIENVLANLLTPRKLDIFTPLFLLSQIKLQKSNRNDWNKWNHVFANTYFKLEDWPIVRILAQITQLKQKYKYCTHYLGKTFYTYLKVTNIQVSYLRVFYDSWKNYKLIVLHLMSPFS